MIAEVHEHDKNVLLTLEDGLIWNKADELREGILKHVRPGKACLGLDMRGVDDIDSVGLGILMGVKST